MIEQRFHDASVEAEAKVIGTKPKGELFPVL